MGGGGRTGAVGGVYMFTCWRMWRRASGSADQPAMKLCEVSVFLFN